MPIDLNKVPQTESVISLKKHADNLESTIIDLHKKSGLDLSKHTARVCVVLDYSGSASDFYKGSKKVVTEKKGGLFGLGKKSETSGIENDSEMQKVLNKLFPLSLKFDDNGELEVWLFQSDFKRLPAMTMDNYEDYINEVALKSRYSFGGTNYSPVIKDIIKKYFQEDTDTTPVYVVFVTDGDNNDKPQTNEVIRMSSGKNIFIQFIGIGDAQFTYLRKLDELDGRVCDNTGFEAFSTLSVEDDKEVYDKILVQYIGWLKDKPF